MREGYILGTATGEGYFIVAIEEGTFRVQPQRGEWVHRA